MSNLCPKTALANKLNTLLEGILVGTEIGTSVCKPIPSKCVPLYKVSVRTNYNDSDYFFSTYTEAYSFLLTKYTSPGAASMAKLEFLYE